MAYLELQDRQSDKDVIVGEVTVVFFSVCGKRTAEKPHGPCLRVATCYLRETRSPIRCHVETYYHFSFRQSLDDWR